ncbi:hypothetical protein AB0A94_28320 [Streptomyces sp. NPDC044984]|uniref:hypothetical protein n=1 Tax=Streptomyces sp. NPDC044984 TaxID=3154335 RepID=UPI0033D467D0
MTAAGLPVLLVLDGRRPEDEELRTVLSDPAGSDTYSMQSVMPTGSSPPRLTGVAGVAAARQRRGIRATTSPVCGKEHRFCPSTGTGIASPAGIRSKYSIGTPP